MIVTFVAAHSGANPPLRDGDRGTHEVKSKGVVTERYEYVVVKGKRVKHGKYEELYSSNGRPQRIGSYDHDKRTGTWTTFDKDGRKVFDHPYVDGLLHGTVTQYATNCGSTQAAQAFETTHHEFGKRHGPYIQYNCAQKKTVEGAYKHGEREGTWRFYGVSGNHVTSSGNYQCGVKSGSWHQYNASGVVTKTETFQADPARLERCTSQTKQAELLGKLLELVVGPELAACSRPERDIVERTPCNIFTGLVMERLFGVKDFVNGKGYLGAAEIHARLKSATLSGGWRAVTAEEAQAMANRGLAVIASSPGHVAVVIPGTGAKSSKWNAFAPDGVSLFLDDRKKDKNAYRCLPCSLNNAFTAQPTYYVRGE